MDDLLDLGGIMLAAGGNNQTLRGGAGSDILSSLSNSSSISGGAGDDILTGSAENDTIDGGEGNDILLGLGGNNTLSGGAGNDILTGGGIAVNNNDLQVTADTNGIDTITGGPGADKFVLGGKPGSQLGTSPVILYNSAGNKDYALIKDFNAGEDTILLGGSKNSYRLDSSPSGLPTGTAIYQQNELIAILQGSSGLNLSGSYFQGSA